VAPATASDLSDPTVRGARTVAFPIGVAEQVAAAIPNARVATLPQARHWVPLDQPDRLRGLVRGIPRQRLARVARRCLCACVE